jgi:hypothetical protein
MAHCRHAVQLSKKSPSANQPQVRNSIAHPPSKHMKVSNYDTIRQNIDGEAGSQQIEQPSNTMNTKTKVSIGLN